MQRIVLFATCILLSLECQSCLLAQQTTASLPTEAMKAMSKLVGAWTSEGKRNGTDEFEGYYLARWNESKTGLIQLMTEGPHISYGLTHWDASEKRLVENWIVHTGLNVRQIYDVSGTDHWVGLAELCLPDGLREEKQIRVDFGYDTFSFSSSKETGKTLEVRNSKIIENSGNSALQSYGQIVAGSTWFNDDAESPAKHTYRWHPGHKVLQLTREENVFPGTALVYYDAPLGVVQWKDVNTRTGTFSNSIFHQTGKNQWRLADFSFGSDKPTFVQIDITAVSEEKLATQGFQYINGQRKAEWRRQWTRDHD